MLHPDLQRAKDSRNHPDWILMYRLKWAQLSDSIDLINRRILDYGSGFGTTANYLARCNSVIAIEPRKDMIEERERENDYTQIQGKIERLKDFEDSSFDVIVCHNVLEFASDGGERAEIVKEFSRLVKSGGYLSIVKNNGNGAGRIMQLVVCGNKVDEAFNLLEGGHISNVFGRVGLYSPEELVSWGGSLIIERVLGIQTFYGLQQNDEVKHQPNWINRMFDLEMKVADMEPYKSVALFHHVLLRKI